MMASERLFPVDSESTTRRVFDEFADRCGATLRRVFKRSGGDGVVFRGWLYTVGESHTDRLGLLREKPLYVAADYLGIPKESLPAETEQEYEALVQQAGWNRVS